MATIVVTRKSRLHNALEALALTAILQSFPTFAAAALLLKLAGDHDLSGDPGVAIFVAFASFTHALIAVTLGPRLPHLFKTVYEPKFFDSHLSLSDKITAWRTPPGRLAATDDDRAAAVGDGRGDGEHWVRE